MCGRKKPKNDTLDVATIAENIEKRDATQYGSQQEMQVEEATDNYRRVEFVVENINECFSGSFLAHQTMYLAMMVIMIFDIFWGQCEIKFVINFILFSSASSSSYSYGTYIYMICRLVKVKVEKVLSYTFVKLFTDQARIIPS